MERRVCVSNGRVVDRRLRLRSRPVVRARRWEWPGLAELVAMSVVAVVVLAAGVGMVLRLLSPRRQARVVVTAVQQVAETAGVVANAVQQATEKAGAAVQQVTEKAGAAAQQAAEKAAAVAGDALVAADVKTAHHSAG